ncbi:hypothetical protein OPV22_002960 [Ensete ventricosum]|uniref:Serine carboxypeptidase S28 family protein n=1 Tax=Ensete ventricosum TaxID=4639 RepID=A0AAV8RZI1_ENSVE|nr:hypothetical protein OPV22_002960 [Ensete ventricosum]
MESCGLRRLQEKNGAYLTREEHWFHQTLDHFSPTSHSRFKQRFYEVLDYYQAPNGPIFLIIGGESELDGIYHSYVSVLAKRFGAALVSLEHRYYGKSSPFKILSTENLRFLSSKQALFDLAVFHKYYQEHLHGKYNMSEYESPWFVIGSSYAGALSAWFHLKFPHLTCGSLASSASILATYNFIEYDQQVGESAGAECKAVLQEITTLVDRKLEEEGQQVKNLFGAAKINNNVDFLYLLADAAAAAFQYGFPDDLCSPLVDAKTNGKDLLRVYATYVKDYYLRRYSSIELYDRQHFRNTTPGEISAVRLWSFQICTEFGNFQVAPKFDAIRSPKIDLRYHLDLCKEIFGEGISPNLNMTNIYYGGTNIAGSRTSEISYVGVLANWFIIGNCDVLQKHFG